MHDTLAVRVIERRAQLQDRAAQQRQRQRAVLARNQIGEVAAAYERHHEIKPFAFASRIDQAEYVRVLQRGQHARLVLEARAQVGIGIESEHLDRHFASGARLACAIHLGHATRDQAFGDHVTAESLAGLGIHRSPPHAPCRAVRLVWRSALPPVT